MALMLFASKQLSMLHQFNITGFLCLIPFQLVFENCGKSWQVCFLGFFPPYSRRFRTSNHYRYIKKYAIVKVRGSLFYFINHENELKWREVLTVRYSCQRHAFNSMNTTIMYNTEENKIKEARPEKSRWTWVKQRKRGLISLTAMKLNLLRAKKTMTIHMRRPYLPRWHPLVNVHNNFLNNCAYKKQFGSSLYCKLIFSSWEQTQHSYIIDN